MAPIADLVGQIGGLVDRIGGFVDRTADLAGRIARRVPPTTLEEVSP